MILFDSLFQLVYIQPDLDIVENCDEEENEIVCSY